MREESHLDDMRSAIRGDFERLAERRGGQELMREPDEQHESASPVDEPPAAESVFEPVLDREEPPEEMDAAPEDAPPAEPPRRSLLDRLLGR